MPTSLDSSNTLKTHILAALQRTLHQQEKTLEQSQANGHDIQELQVLIDLFRHPEVSVSQLAEMFEGTLTALAESAKLSMTASERTNVILDDLLQQGAKQQRQNNALLNIFEEQRSDMRVMMREMTQLREENRTLRYHLGVENEELDDA